MLEKLLLLAVEEMTLLSRIYRPGTGNEQLNIRTIEIRDLMPTLTDDQEHTVVPAMSMENILAERDALLAQAKQQIANERQQFDGHCEQISAQLRQQQQSWEEEKIHLQQSAYDEGFSQGMEDGRQKAFENMAEMIQVTNNTMAQSEQNAHAYLERQEGVILQLAIRSAQRILNETLEAQPEKFVSIIQRALKEVRESEFVKIYVSTSNYGLLTANRDELVAMFPPDMPFMIFIDDVLGDQECYIDTNHGRLVATIDEQLNELRKHLSTILESVE